MIEPSLGEVVRAFQSGSREAFSVLVTRYQSLVTSVAFATTGDLQRSEDLAQQAFLIAWQKQAELHDPSRFGGWIREITKNLARNDRRLKANLQQKSAVSLSRQNEPAHSSTPDQLTSRREQNELLWATLDQIPLEYREPLVLFYREGQSVAKVAEMMGLSEDAVKQRLKRGRAMLKREIEGMVEQFLVETRPTSTFSSGVLAALPVLGASTGSVAVKSGSAVIAKASGAKVAGLMATGASIGLMGGLVGLLGGVGGAWWGTKNSINHATSDEEVHLHQSTFVYSLLLSLMMTAGLLIAVFCFDGGMAVGLVVATQVLFFGLLAAIIVRSVARQKSLHAIHGKPECMKRQSGGGAAGTVSTAALRLNALGMIGGCWMWLVLYLAMGQAWVLLSISVTLLVSHLIMIWKSAPYAVTTADQVRFNAQACLTMSVIQFALISGGWWLGVRVFNVDYQGVPMGWTGVFVLAIGGGGAWMLYRKAAVIERLSHRRYE